MTALTFYELWLPKAITLSQGVTALQYQPFMCDRLTAITFQQRFCCLAAIALNRGLISPHTTLNHGLAALQTQHSTKLGLLYSLITPQWP